MVPSARQRARSPVRYIRAPALYGSATYLGRQGGLVEVATGEATAADVQLPRVAVGHRAGVGELVGEPFGRLVPVDRKVGGARLEHTQDRGHEVHTARQGHPDHLTDPYPAQAEQAGEPVGPPVQVGVRERVLFAHHRDGCRAGAATASKAAGQVSSGQSTKGRTPTEFGWGSASVFGICGVSWGRCGGSTGRASAGSGPTRTGCSARC